VRLGMRLRWIGPIDELNLERRPLPRLRRLRLTVFLYLCKE